MADQVDICNMSLRHIAASRINAIDEGSTESNVIQDYFDFLLEKELRLSPWSWATATAELAVVDSEEPPDYAYAFQLPADYLMIQQILETYTNNVVYDNWDQFYTSTARRNDEWEVRDGKLYTNLSEIYIKYTKVITDYAILDSTFVLAFSHLLAHYIAPSLTTRDDLAAQQYGLYLSNINIARGMNGAEQRRRVHISRDHLSSRNYYR